MRKLWLLLIFTLPIMGYAQEKQLSQPAASFVAIIVNNIDTSANWYRNNLGFEITNRTDNQERGYRQANPTLGKTSIELIEINNSVKPDESARTQGFFKFGFSVSDFEKWVSHLEKQGVEFHGSVVTNPADGKKMLIVKDPDGNRIQFFEK